MFFWYWVSGVLNIRENLNTRENRQRFVETCLGNDLQVMNTYFEKSKEHQVTQKARSGEESFQPPWETDRYTQMDYVLVNKRWKNTITDVESRPRAYFNSDHCIVIAKIRVKLTKNGQKNNMEEIIRYRKPSKEQKDKYNEKIKDARQ